MVCAEGVAVAIFVVIIISGDMKLAGFIFAAALCCAACGCSSEHARLQREISTVTDGVNATVGVAFVAGDDRFAFNDAERYPMMSVFKFHVAFAALCRMQENGVSPCDSLWVDTSQMHDNTYSPLREFRGKGGFNLALADAVRYCISMSDNNVCDILIDYCGGIDSVALRLEKLGISGYELSETEDTMHADIMRCYNNWSTPSAAVDVLQAVYEGGCLSEPYLTLLEDAMLETSTGTDKLRAGVPHGVVFGHKTGSSDRLGDGVKIGDNDAGVIYLPDGRRCYIAVFVMNSSETDAVNARVIADIGDCVYRYLAGE